ncbi:class I SAM-dependent methyltransferase [uncultured Umboniibacter sp.]|uniref:class I SAM-dependent methyltransferase n=1 Tax=uncultured Umboniibacter sp. TaxID=1798917 RepID=UPI0026145276|nr:class I SAM-dependent methyltransferase [uncultured Umboniibacter sp.]
MSVLRHLISVSGEESDISSLAVELDLQVVTESNDELALRWSSGQLSLHFPNQQQGDVLVDFDNGAMQYRVKHGGGFGQAVAKACALSPRVLPSVLDMTAGLGRDGFVLASLGCDVTLVERQPIVHALLADGLRRAESSLDSRNIVRRISLRRGDSSELVGQQYEVVYVDPMFPERKKSAAVKKEMAAFHQLVGTDEDADLLLAKALEFATHRVVVKRPKGAPFLADRKPSQSLTGKSGRFDIYALRSMAADKFKSSVDE